MDGADRGGGCSADHPSAAAGHVGGGAAAVADRRLQAFDEFYNALVSVGTYPPFARPPLVYLYLISLGQGSQDLGWAARAR